MDTRSIPANYAKKIPNIDICYQYASMDMNQVIIVKDVEIAAMVGDRM